MIYTLYIYKNISSIKRYFSTFALRKETVMGISFRKRIRIGKGTFLNISKKGISISQKIGNVTFNSRGTTTVNLGNGITYRTSKKKRSK